MTTAIIGTGRIGSVIARQLASGGETLRLSSADIESARTLAAEIGHAAIVTVDNRDALQDADAVVLALRFTVLKSADGGRYLRAALVDVGHHDPGAASRQQPGRRSADVVGAVW
jgi:predicted dinucleotide-binding enzyme